MENDAHLYFYFVFDFILVVLFSTYISESNHKRVLSAHRPYQELHLSVYNKWQNKKIGEVVTGCSHFVFVYIHILYFLTLVFVFLSRICMTKVQNDAGGCFACVCIHILYLLLFISCIFFKHAVCICVYRFHRNRFWKALVDGAVLLVFV